MENNDEIAYAEIDEILNNLEDEYVERIPTKIIEFFKEEKSKEYNPVIRADIPLEEQNLNRNTLVILAILNLNYWCDTEDEKQEILEEFAKNEQEKIKEQEELYEKYNPDNLFKQKKQANKIDDNTLSMVQYNKTNFIQKLLSKIKSLFKRGN